MLRVTGHSSESLILDGEWFEKHRSGMTKTRLPASTFVSVEVKEVERRKKLFGGDKEQVLQAILRFDGGPYVGFTVDAAQREELQAILDGLATARDTAG